jgi:hypothetical protein
VAGRDAHADLALSTPSPLIAPQASSRASLGVRRRDSHSTLSVHDPELSREVAHRTGEGTYGRQYTESGAPAEDPRRSPAPGVVTASSFVVRGTGSDRVDALADRRPPSRSSEELRFLRRELILGQHASITERDQLRELVGDADSSGRSRWHWFATRAFPPYGQDDHHDHNDQRRDRQNREDHEQLGWSKVHAVTVTLRGGGELPLVDHRVLGPMVSGDNEKRQVDATHP